MSTVTLTALQKRILDALSKTSPLSNAQVAEAAECHESYSSKTLSRFERLRLARSQYVQDKKDPQTHYRLWWRA